MAPAQLPGLKALPPLDEMSVTADYEALLDRCARLTAYAGSSPQHIFWPIVERQDRLAEDDLIIFALRARRFISATSLIHLAHNVFVPIGPLGKSDFKHVWCIINTIVHHTFLTIVRSVSELKIIHKTLEGTLIYNDVIRDSSSEPLGPIIFVISDQRSLVFDIPIFLKTFHERILRPAVTSCRERGVELTGIQRDSGKLAEYFQGLQ